MGVKEEGVTQTGKKKLEENFAEQEAWLFHEFQPKNDFAQDFLTPQQISEFKRKAASQKFEKNSNSFGLSHSNPTSNFDTTVLKNNDPATSTNPNRNNISGPNNFKSQPSNSMQSNLAASGLISHPKLQASGPTQSLVHTSSGGNASSLASSGSSNPSDNSNGMSLILRNMLKNAPNDSTREYILECAKNQGLSLEDPVSDSLNIDDIGEIDFSDDNSIEGFSSFNNNNNFGNTLSNNGFENNEFGNSNNFQNNGFENNEFGNNGFENNEFSNNGFESNSFGNNNDFDNLPERRNLFSEYAADSNKQSSSDAVPLMLPHSNSTQSSQKYGHKNFPWSGRIDQAMRKILGHTKFRNNQLEIINATMSNRDVFVLMPTGGGKSLCFQVPAEASDGLTIVICPLISLMQDQVSALTGFNIRAEHLGSTVSFEKSGEIFKELRNNTEDPIKVLYVTPEKLTGSAYTTQVFDELYRKGRLSRFVIDEAHCVSQWGHEFREDYLALGAIKKHWPDTPMLALTATATQKVKADIFEKLKMNNPLTFQSSFNRPNLRYSVLDKKSKLPENASKIAELINKTHPRDSGIIYCLSRENTEELAKELRQNKISCQHYHAGMEPEKREKVQELWQNDKIRVICATIAFGLGINKPDVRFVYHYTLSKSIEGYYQESGRAGRDGRISDCILFYTKKDSQALRNMIGRTVSESSKSPAEKQILSSTLNENLQKMVSYAENRLVCRRILQLEYLGEKFDPKNCRKTCDNCQKNIQSVEVDISKETQSIVQMLVDAASKKVNISAGHLVQAWRGVTVKNHQEFESLKNHGKGKSVKKPVATSYVNELLANGFLREEQFLHHKYPVNYLRCVQPHCQQLLNGQKKLKIRSAIQDKQYQISNMVTTTRSKDAQSGDGNLEEQLYNILDAVRQEQAKKTNIGSYYNVIPNSVLKDLSEHRPTTEEGLRRLNMGDYKIKQYGAAFLSAIQQFIKENPELLQQTRLSRSGNANMEKRSHDIVDLEEDDFEPIRGRKAKFGL